MSEAFHVGFDCDGVLRNLHKTAFELFFEKHPDLKSHFKDPPIPTSWGFQSALKEYDKEVYDKLTSFVFENVESSYKVFRNARVFNGVKEFSRFYKMLKKAGGQVSICTTQKKPWHKIATIQWLEDSSVAYDNVILTGDQKGYFGLDYLIDDKWQNIAAVEKSGGVGYLYNRKWNSKSRNRVKYTVDSVEKYVKKVLDREVNLT